jgi:dUTP pyrophosphatase
MKVKFKKLDPKAVIPTYANPGDAGLDLTVTRISRYTTATSRQYFYYTGLSVEIPEGYVGLIFPRSSIYKTNLTLTNSVGVIDSGYRGEIKAVFNLTYIGHFRGGYPYQVGDRVAQLVIVPIPKIEIEEVDELTPTERGAQGFGSSGK